MTKNSKVSLADWVRLIRRLQDRRSTNDEISGQLYIENSADRDALEAILRRHEDFPCQVESGDPDAVALGQTYRLNFGLPRLGIGYVVRDIETWLKHESARCGRMRHWYVVSEDWLDSEGDSQLCPNYQILIEFIQLLEKSAVVVDKDDAKIIFVPKERFDLPIDYGEKELRTLDTEAIRSIINLVNTHDGHAKQCLEILATALYDMLKEIPESERFKVLLSRLPELAHRCNDGYELFASSFSFEKIREQVEAMRVEYTTRIHKALSDIQGQLLGIPISTIVVATQLKKCDAPGAEMWGNIAVLLGAIIFVALLVLAIRNQWHTLDVISLEVDRQENATEKNSPEMKQRFSLVFSGLRARISHQRIIMVVITCACLLGLGLAFTMFWTLTQPALAIFF